MIEIKKILYLRMMLETEKVEKHLKYTVVLILAFASYSSSIAFAAVAPF